MSAPNAKTNVEIIGIDHGYKNMKTHNCIFPTAITKLPERPDDLEDVLEFNGSYYTVSGRPVSSVENRDKSCSEEFYLLTLPALAKELAFRKKQANTEKPLEVCLAVGLPYKWYDSQKEGFRKKIMSNPELKFYYEGRKYYLRLIHTSVFMQGTSALITGNKECRDGYKLVVDIGGETINIIPMENGKVIREDCRIIASATIALMNRIREEVEARFYENIRENEVIHIIKRGKKHTSDEIDQFIQEQLTEYCRDVERKLLGFGFNLNRSDLVYEGGGATIFKNFGDRREKVFYITDLCANARGYEITEMLRQKRSGKVKA